MPKTVRDDPGEPLVVKPRQACVLLGCGITRLYALLAAGELDSYRDGGSRKVTLASIRKYVTRHLASAGRPTAAETPQATQRHDVP